MRRLVALRIPAAWEVTFNAFVELGDPAELSERERRNLLSQDLLLLRSTSPEGTPSSGHLLDVGWSPDGDPAGRYVLQVIRDNDWEAPALQLESPSADVIRDAIELALHGLNLGDAPERIQRILDAAMEA